MAYSPWGCKELNTTERLNMGQAVIGDGVPWGLSGKESTY